MKRINREAIQRMVDAHGGKAGGTNGGGGGSLAGYATQAWVNEGFVSIEFFNRLFTVYGPGETSSDPDVVIEPNDLDSTIKNIKAMFGLWTEQYLSALGLNPGGTGSATSLSMLDDVNITTPTNGQALVYNSTSQKWENETISTVTALANLTDVLLTSVADGQTLLYNSISQQWYNSSLKTINGQSLLGSGDISVGGGASGNYLPLSGGTLVGDVTTTAKIILSQSYGLYVGPSTSGVRKIYGADSSNGTYTRMASYAMIPDNDADDCWQVRPWNGGFVDSYMTVMHGGKIGMGTNAPTHDLHVNGVARIKNILLGVQDDQINVMNGGTLYISHNNSTGNVCFCTGSTTGGVGIGTLTPQYKLHVDGSIYATGIINNVVKIINNSTVARLHITSVYSNVDYVELHCSNLDNSRTDRPLVLQNGYGNVGIGIATPSYKLHVSGTIYATGEIVALSDMRKKLVMKNVDLDVNTIAEAPSFLYYKRNDKEDNDLHVGSSAQYWEKVLPEAVKRDKEGTLSMSYGVVALVAAVSTAKKVRELDERVTKLEKIER